MQLTGPAERAIGNADTGQAPRNKGRGRVRCSDGFGRVADRLRFADRGASAERDRPVSASGPRTDATRPLARRPWRGGHWPAGHCAAARGPLTDSDPPGPAGRGASAEREQHPCVSAAPAPLIGPLGTQSPHHRRASAEPPTRLSGAPRIGPPPRAGARHEHPAPSLAERSSSPAAGPPTRSRNNALYSGPVQRRVRLPCSPAGRFRPCALRP
jgi:hypothetical protein